MRGRPRAPRRPTPPRLSRVATACAGEAAPPDRFAERDEIRAGRRQRRHILEARRIGDARRLENLRPPGDAFDRFGERRDEAVAARFAEHHIIGAGFARRHGVVAAAQARRRRRCVRDAGSPALRRAPRRLRRYARRRPRRAPPVARRLRAGSPRHRAPPPPAGARRCAWRRPWLRARCARSALATSPAASASAKRGAKPATLSAVSGGVKR